MISVDNKVKNIYYMLCYSFYGDLLSEKEEESYKELTSQYKLDNLYLSVDMVLLGGEVNRDEIYKEKIQPKHFEILENSVGIIPNKKVLEHSKEEDIINLYKGIIDRLLQIGRNIYIVQHITSTPWSDSILQSLEYLIERVILP